MDNTKYAYVERVIILFFVNLHNQIINVHKYIYKHFEISNNK